MNIDNSDQANINNTNSTRVNSGGVVSYDLIAEKERILLGIEEIKKEISNKFAKKYTGAQIFPEPIAAIHAGVVDFLLSFNLVSVYDSIAKQAGLDAKTRNTLPRIVWQIAQTKNWNGLDVILEANLHLPRPTQAIVSQLLQQNILSKVKEISEKTAAPKNSSEQQVSKKEVQLPLSVALVQYPKLGEQNITLSPIKLRYASETVRPSIKNWMKDFHDAMGAMTHSPIDRGNFLFHSENGKKLSAVERQKLGTILKSLDEKTLLTIDTQAQAVVFESIEKPAAVVNQPVSIQNNVEIVDLKQNVATTESLQPAKTTVGTANMAPAFASVNPQPIFDEKSVHEFYVKHPNSTVSRILPTDNARKSEMPAQSDQQKNKSAYFSVPGSKPPIGTDTFHVENTDETRIDGGLKTDHESLANDIQSADFINDEDLYKMIQEKKNKSVNLVQGGDVIEDVMHFSSPQKLPAEQAAKQNISSVSFSRPQQTAAQNQAAQNYAPKGHTQEDGVRIQKNIVDLKN